MDSELGGRKPIERSHRKVVGAAVMDGELFCKIIQGIKAMAGIEAFLVFPVAAFHLSVVSGGVWAYQLVPDS